MSVRVLAEVFESSDAEHADRLVLIAIADNASDDGVAWPEQETIARKTRLGVSTVRQALKRLDTAGELERRTAQRGRRRIAVYRIVVGAIAETTIDYDRLPFELSRPFDDRQKRAVADHDHRQDLAPTTARIEHAHIEEEPSERTTIPAAATRGQRDAAWDTLEELYGTVAPHERSRRGKIARDLAVALVDHYGAGVTPQAIADEIRRRAKAYRQAWPQAAFTDTALHARWSVFAPAVERATTPAERARRWIEATGWQLERDDAATILRDFGLEPARLERALDYRDTVAAEHRRATQTTDQLTREAE